MLAAAVLAERPSPAADVSAMDGYAVREADLAILPVTLPVAGESFAGAGFAGALPKGACIRIFTGAPLPAGSDRVIIQEEVQRDGDRARFERPLSPRRHLRVAGSDFQPGDLLVPAGVRLNAQRLVAAAAANLGAVTVHRRPRLAVLATGDELAEPGASGLRGTQSLRACHSASPPWPRTGAPPSGRDIAAATTFPGSGRWRPGPSKKPTSWW